MQLLIEFYCIKSDYLFCIWLINLALICLVIFLLLFHAGFIFLWSSLRFLWKMEPFCSVYTAGWKTRPPDCKYKHGTGFLKPVHSHTYHSRAIKVFKVISILSKTRHIFFHLYSAPVCSPLKLCFGLMRVWRLSLHGLFLWCSDLETIQMSRSFILQFIRSLAFVWWERKAQAHIAFHDLLCQTSTQTNRWEPWCELLVDQTHQTWVTPAQSLIRHSCLQSSHSALFPSSSDGNLQPC